MHRAFVVLCFFLLVSCATAPTTATPARQPQPDANYIQELNTQSAQVAMCKKVSCAHNIRISLKKKDGSTFDKVFPVMPVVQPIGVSVYAGQTVFFEANVEDDQLVGLHQVKTIEHPEKTISANLVQSNDGGMRLTLENPFQRYLKINMGIMPLDQESMIKTSSCPVMPGKIGIELWPYPIFQVWLANMRLLKPSADLVCSK